MIPILIVSLRHIDTVTNTASTTFDATKNVMASAVDKGSAVIGSAKGITFKYMSSIVTNKIQQ